MKISYYSFFTDFCEDVIAAGDRYWLILRSVLNQVLIVLTHKPHLLLGLEFFVIRLATCREMRSLDADIKLYKTEILIPQVVKKKYENLAMDEIAYQGAFVRSMTLLVLDSIINEHSR